MALNKVDPRIPFSGYRSCYPTIRVIFWLKRSLSPTCQEILDNVQHVKPDRVFDEYDKFIKKHSLPPCTFRVSTVNSIDSVTGEVFSSTESKGCITSLLISVIPIPLKQ